MHRVAATEERTTHLYTGGAMLRLLFLILGIIIGSGNLLFAFECMHDDYFVYYPMYCRGKIPVDIYWAGGTNPDLANVRMRIMTHMPTGAGAEGENLIKGTCAFEDRPINAQEPDIIVVNASTHVAYSGVGVLERCLSEEQCVARLCVTNSNGESFVSQPYFVLSTFYPKFNWTIPRF
jgi:hypothetical protein